MHSTFLETYRVSKRISALAWEASPAAKLRRIWISQAPRPTYDEAALSGRMARSTFAKWMTMKDPEYVPERKYVEALMTAWGYPPSMVEWVYNRRNSEPPVPLASTEILSPKDYPDPINDVLQGRMAELPCWQAIGKSEFEAAPTGEPLEIPRSMMIEGAVGLTIGPLDDSLRGVADQGNTIMVKPNRKVQIGDLILAINGKRAVLKVLRLGEDGYELHFANHKKYPDIEPADGFTIYGTGVAIIKDVDSSRLNIDLRFAGIRV